MNYTVVCMVEAVLDYLCALMWSASWQCRHGAAFAATKIATSLKTSHELRAKWNVTMLEAMKVGGRYALN